MSSPQRFSLCSDHVDTKSRKQLMFSMFILLAATLIFVLFFNIQFRYKMNYQKQPSWGALLKSFQKSFINFLIVKVDLKFKQKPRNINVTDFILRPVARAIPIIWNTLRCLNKFTAWKVSQYGVSSGPYSPVSCPNTGKYGPEKTPYLDTFHAVIVPASLNIPLLKAGDKN